MRLIKQGDPYGCGLACVAMLAGISYAAVRKTYRELSDTTRYDAVEPTQLPMLKKIMGRHGVVVEGRMRRIGDQSLNELDCDALLKVNPRADGEEWHWVIWDHRRRRVLDPKVPPYKRLKPVAYWRLRRVSVFEG
jgi:hypothetical protein